MADLSNSWHNHGDSGSKPADGKDYAGGDNLHAQVVDFLFNQQRLDKDEIDNAILRRIRHLHGDVALNGLVATTGTNALEVDVSSGDGYVDGQYTDAVSATTVTLSTNGTTSTRTDSIWVDTSGQVGKSDGTTSVSDSRMKLAEADVETDDTISDIRNYARDAVRVFASENKPSSANNGDRWYDHSSDTVETYIAGSWTTLLPADGSVPLDGTFTLNGDLKDGAGNTVYSQTNNYVPEARVATISLGAGTDNDVASNDLVDGATVIWDTSNGYVPQAQVQQGSGSGLNSDKVDGKDAGDIGATYLNDSEQIMASLGG